MDVVGRDSGRPRTSEGEGGPPVEDFDEASWELDRDSLSWWVDFRRPALDDEPVASDARLFTLAIRFSVSSAPSSSMLLTLSFRWPALGRLRLLRPRELASASAARATAEAACESSSYELCDLVG